MTVYDSGRPTPQERRPAAAGPTDARGSHGVRRPAATGPTIGRARSGHGGRTRQPTRTCPNAKVAGTAHLTHRQASSSYCCRGLEQRRQLSHHDNTQALRGKRPADSDNASPPAVKIMFPGRLPPGNG